MLLIGVMACSLGPGLIPALCWVNPTTQSSTPINVDVTPQSFPPCSAVVFTFLSKSHISTKHAAVLQYWNSCPKLDRFWWKRECKERKIGSEFFSRNLIEKQPVPFITRLVSRLCFIWRNTERIKWDEETMFWCDVREDVIGLECFVSLGTMKYKVNMEIQQSDYAFDKWRREKKITSEIVLSYFQ